jgi:WD40 repeat protein
VLTVIKYFIQKPQYIFGGGEDGSIQVWNITHNQPKNKTLIPVINNSQFLCDLGHESSVINIQLFNSQMWSAQLISLDEQGKMIVWSFKQNPN